jgi:hypothetical protein
MTLESVTTAIIRVEAVVFFLWGVENTFGLLGRVPFYSAERMHSTHWELGLVFPAFRFLIAFALYLGSGAIARFICRTIDRS